MIVVVKICDQTRHRATPVKNGVIARPVPVWVCHSILPHLLCPAGTQGTFDEEEQVGGRGEEIRRKKRRNFSVIFFNTSGVINNC